MKLWINILIWSSKEISNSMPNLTINYFVQMPCDLISKVNHAHSLQILKVILYKNERSLKNIIYDKSQVRSNINLLICLMHVCYAK